MSRSSRWILIAAAIAVVAGAGTVLVAVANTADPVPLSVAPTHRPSANLTPSASATPSAPTTPSTSATPAYIQPDAATLATLPDANYNAVISGLLDAAVAASLPLLGETFTLKADLTPLYGADRSGAPVASLPFLNFLGARTVVVPVVVHDDGWAEILTPSRRQLPSASGTGIAASQTMAWVRTDQLVAGAPVRQHALVNISTQKLSIINTADGTVTATYSVGVGKADTATPLGLTYLQARYRDPKQVTGHQIYLTAAHSSVADRPFGPDQGLVGLHWSAVNTGAVSHACIRLNAAGDNAISKLEDGTRVLVVE
ncbi:L,D-transpeptidase [Frigoribacterium sp. CG_9.8]|uniref:L,D-transpeptidase n=1 Tax=Frigoribacterium sp. CG_9.8 TaxID=2787733 RepID=UPI0018CACF26|nr:L,D-transpeptidase [Frigoribacterium sp. CG_9.8]MBG6106528.1 hypothetical protein [Frigoribacterium sp. CG_9.8]